MNDAARVGAVQAVTLTFGFVAGASAIMYLILSDPEVRGVFRRKSERMKGATWHGFANEVAHAVGLEVHDAMRQAMPGIVRELRGES